MRICISGENGAGKTTIADYLVGLGFTEFSFGELLKEVSAMVLGVPLKLLEGREHREERENMIIEPWNITGRQALIAIGEMFRDHFNENTWVHGVDRALMLAISEGKTRFVISDVRKENEKKYALERGFIHIYVTKKTREEANNHCELIDKNTIIVVNDSTKEELYRKIDDILSELA